VVLDRFQLSGNGVYQALAGQFDGSVFQTNTASSKTSVNCAANLKSIAR
jgi:hypothetical protein